MPIFFPGRTTCHLCRKVIESVDEVVMFPPFVDNEADPLHGFSDSIFHKACFDAHPLSRAAQERYELVEARCRSRTCRVCGRTIDSFDDFFVLGLLTEDEGHALHPYNFARFHLSCLPSWPGLPELYARLRDLEAGGNWRGYGPRYILQTLKRCLER